MSLYTVPADVEPSCVVDLIEDCREVSGMLGSFVPTGARLPLPRRGPSSAVDPSAAALLEGYSEYGS